MHRLYVEYTKHSCVQRSTTGIPGMSVKRVSDVHLMLHLTCTETASLCIGSTDTGACTSDMGRDCMDCRGLLMRDVHVLEDVADAAKVAQVCTKQATLLTLVS